MQTIFMRNKGTYNLLKKHIDLPEVLSRRKSWRKAAQNTMVAKGGALAALNKLTMLVLSSDSEDND